jgi:autocrine motility factor receptor
MFPDYPMDALIDDLRETRSVDATVENILEGRLLPMQDYPSFQNKQSLLDLSTSLTPTISSQETKEKQFLEDPEERQHILHSRKRVLLEEKRKQFIQRHQAHDVSNNS